jgi:tetratricopeptide (TPR) repeat protein
LNFFKKYFWFLIASIIIVVFFIFIPYKNKKSSNKHSHEDSGITIEEFQKDLLSTSNSEFIDSFEIFNQHVSTSNDSLSKIQSYSNIIAFLNRKEQPELASLFVFRKADWIKNTNSWVLTGDNFINLLLYDSLNAKVVNDIKQKAVYSYEKAVSLDSNNIEAKLKLAQCYMEIQNEPMLGVQILLKIVEKNPNQIDAQMLLSKFGLISGQFEKVAPRLEKILSLQPDNIQALLMKADMFAQQGKKEETAKILNQVIKMPKISNNLKEQLIIAVKDIETQKK